MMACVSSPATANQQRYMNPAATVTPQGYRDRSDVFHWFRPLRSWISLPDWWWGYSANRQTNKQMPAVT